MNIHRRRDNDNVTILGESGRRWISKRLSSVHKSPSLFHSMDLSIRTSDTHLRGTRHVTYSFRLLRFFAWRTRNPKFFHREQLPLKRIGRIVRFLEFRATPGVIFRPRGHRDSRKVSHSIMQIARLPWNIHDNPRFEKVELGRIEGDKSGRICNNRPCLDTRGLEKRVWRQHALLSLPPSRPYDIDFRGKIRSLDGNNQTDNRYPKETNSTCNRICLRKCTACIYDRVRVCVSQKKRNSRGRVFESYCEKNCKSREEGKLNRKGKIKNRLLRLVT